MKNLKEIIIKRSQSLVGFKISRNRFSDILTWKVHRAICLNIEDNSGRDIISHIHEDLYFTKFLPDRDSPSIAFLPPDSIIG